MFDGWVVVGLFTEIGDIYTGDTIGVPTEWKRFRSTPNPAWRQWRVSGCVGAAPGLEAVGEQHGSHVTGWRDDSPHQSPPGIWKSSRVSSKSWRLYNVDCRSCKRRSMASTGWRSSWRDAAWATGTKAILLNWQVAKVRIIETWHLGRLLWFSFWTCLGIRRTARRRSVSSFGWALFSLHSRVYSKGSIVLLRCWWIGVFHSFLLVYRRVSIT